MTAPSQRAPRFGRREILWLAAGVFLGSALLVAGNAWRKPHRSGDPYVETHGAHLERLDLNASHGRVVFVGDSNLLALDVSRVTTRGLNLSIGGDTAANLIRRLKQYRSPKQARAVVLNVGLNDLMRRCAVPPDTPTQLLGAVPPDVPVVILGLQNVSSSKRPERCADNFADLVRRYNAVLLAGCSQRGSCIYVTNPAAEDPAEARHSDLRESDGVHLSPQGYDLLAGSLRTALRTLGVPGEPIE